MKSEIQTILEYGADIVLQEMEALKQLACELDEDFAHAVKLILKTQGRVIVTGMGKSGHIAKKAAATFASTGTASFFIHPAEASHGDLGMVMKEDIIIAISNSGNTAELSDIILYATRYNIPLIAITQKKESKLGRLAKYCLCIPKVAEACPIECAPTSTTTASLVICDALAMVTLRLRGFTAAQFNIYHPGGSLGKSLMPIGEVMQKNIPLVGEDMSMDTVLDVMSGHGFGCVGIVRDKKLIGIVTDGDLRRHIDAHFLEKKVSAVMTISPITIVADTLSSQAIHIMESKKITSLFVVNEAGEPIGIVNIHMLLKI